VQNGPMTPEVYGELRGAQPGEPMTDKLRYQRVVGSLLHLAQCTRPDIALSVAALAANSSEPSAQHFAGCGTVCGRDRNPWDHLWKKGAPTGILV
jgi:hypothetical protein